MQDSYILTITEGLSGLIYAKPLNIPLNMTSS